MTLTLTRYLRTDLLAKSRLSIDGAPFCEAREALNTATGEVLNHLTPGTYRCRCAASVLSPMTLLVCRRPGQRRVAIGFDPLRQVRGPMICIGEADTAAPPAERQLVRADETFARFTQRVYAAYEAAEEFVLEVREGDMGVSSER